MIAAIDGHAVYDVLVVAHVACAIVGFGALAISGVYGFTGRRADGTGSLDDARRYFASPGCLELLVLAVPVLGVAALAVEPGGRGVGQLWDLLALLVWAVAGVAVLRFVRPAEADLRRLLAGADPDAASLTAPAARLAWGSIVTDITFFIALLLMVFQPH